MINWNNVVSAVATHEGLVVQERRADGTLGAAQVYRQVHPCPPGQVWDPVVGQCRSFKVVDEAGKHINYMQVHPCPPGQVWDPGSGRCRSYRIVDEAGR